MVFSNTKNSFIKPAKTNDWLKLIINKNSLPAISTHGFRHTHCSLLFEAGESIKYVQDRLGHSDVKTTIDVYAHVTASVKEDAIKKFESYLN
ncbi:MAG: tyrosine-type recombinase/integrase [Psychrobacillus sp.]